MENSRKVFVLILDGVSVRNFVFTDFPEIAKSEGLELTFWNATPFDLASLGHREIKFDMSPTHPFSQPLKMAKNRVELDINKNLDGDEIYDSYHFPLKTKDLNSWFKNTAADFLKFRFHGKKGARKLTSKIYKSERQTLHYQNVLKTLSAEKPDFLFCANQRHLPSIAGVAAAQDLGITTGSFIFSWDNLPKATLMTETDYYFVWSEHMKSELKKYYPFIKENQIRITGTPQFEPHNNASFVIEKSEFYRKYNLDESIKYICFSGDDTTTSPFDDQYLLDVAKAVRQLNENGNNLGIIFRRCPVDFSARYDDVLQKYPEIKVINPDWQSIGSTWSSVVPMKNDLRLLISTIYYSEMVVNLGSSMVFDFAAFGKPCAFINYKVEQEKDSKWSIEMIYRLIHFKSMTSKDCVVWLDNPNTIGDKIVNTIENASTNVAPAKTWFAKIVNQPTNQASKNIATQISTMINSK